MKAIGDWNGRKRNWLWKTQVQGFIKRIVWHLRTELLLLNWNWINSLRLWKTRKGRDLTQEDLDLMVTGMGTGTQDQGMDVKKEGITGGMKGEVVSQGVWNERKLLFENYPLHGCPISTSCSIHSNTTSASIPAVHAKLSSNSTTESSTTWSQLGIDFVKKHRSITTVSLGW